jgi:hypothetical protein
VRTTLSIDDDVLIAAKDLAAKQRRSLGEVISDLARTALQPDAPDRRTRNGIPLLPHRPGAKPVTPELVDRLRDDLARSSAQPG